MSYSFITELQRLTDAVLWDMLCDFRPETLPTLQQIGYLSGGRYLLRLAEETARQGLSNAGQSLRARSDASRCWRICSACCSGAPTTTARRWYRCCARSARQRCWRSCRTRGPTRPRSARRWLGGQRRAGRAAAPAGRPQPGPLGRPSAGVVRRQESWTSSSRWTRSTLRDPARLLRRRSCPAAVVLVRAALGWNRKEVRRLFGRRNQLAARALALLPLEKPDELLQRYLMLTKYQREANGSGAGRKAYERAAAQAGLTNLALHAGYADATRLEWAMEDRLGAQAVSLGRQWEIEGYTLTLALRDGGPAVEVRNRQRGCSSARLGGHARLCLPRGARDAGAGAGPGAPLSPGIPRRHAPRPAAQRR